MKKIKSFPGMEVYHAKLMYGAICLPGIGIIINKDQFNEKMLDCVLQHEYGHYLDFKKSEDLKPFPFLQFYLKIGIPSFINALTGLGGPHNTFWTEIRANKRAKEYFGPDLKSNYEKYFPVS